MPDNSDQQLEPEVPNTFDRWLTGALVAAGIFAILGFASFIVH